MIVLPIMIMQLALIISTGKVKTLPALIQNTETSEWDNRDGKKHDPLSGDVGAVSAKIAKKK